jgi:o-succinylbenzoate synthase
MSSANLQIIDHTLHFHFEAGTSRGVLTEKKSYYVRIQSDGKFGIGEAGPLAGLSPDYAVDCLPAYQKTLDSLGPIPVGKSGISTFIQQIPFHQPALRFAVESALLDLFAQIPGQYFDNSFSRGETNIPINGLIWMGKPDFMADQIEQKLKDGYSCLKLKIGALDFDTELGLLANLRKRFSKDQLTLRVDANGAFSPNEAISKLEKLARYDLHSIEQPIRAGQWEEMAKLCRQEIIPIALDEELIGQKNPELVLDAIQPQFTIFKPSFLGGFEATRGWIEACEKRRIHWWITSALESNIGLQAIAQFTGEFPVSMPQGLGTGQLYTNNFGSGLSIERGNICFDQTFGREIPFQGLSL